MKLLRTTLSAALVLVSFLVSAQEKEVMAVVQSIFDGMATNDGAMVEKAFTADAKMYTVVVDKDGVVQKREGSLAKFVEAVNGEKEKAFNEPIWNERVEIDGPLASVWVDYAFYFGNEFHHCGVDAFHLMKTEEGWKVFHIVDTRRTEGCIIPRKISKQYE